MAPGVYVVERQTSRRKSRPHRAPRRNLRPPSLTPWLMSALPPKADINRRERHVRFVPIASLTQRS